MGHRHRCGLALSSLFSVIYLFIYYLFEQFNHWERKRERELGVSFGNPKLKFN